MPLYAPSVIFWLKPERRKAGDVENRRKRANRGIRLPFGRLLRRLRLDVNFHKMRTRRCVRLTPLCLPGISPSRGEIGKRLFHRFIRKPRDGRDLAADRSPPLRGRCPAGQRGVSPTRLWVRVNEKPCESQHLDRDALVIEPVDFGIIRRDEHGIAVFAFELAIGPCGDGPDA